MGDSDRVPVGIDYHVPVGRFMHKQAFTGTNKPTSICQFCSRFPASKCRKALACKALRDFVRLFTIPIIYIYGNVERLPGRAVNRNRNGRIRKRAFPFANQPEKVALADESG